MNNIICGGDVHTPRAAADALAAVARVYSDLFASIEQSYANQQAQGVSGAPLTLLAAMSDAATTAAAAAKSGAAEAEAHCVKVQDTVGSNPSLAGTQTGRYMDPAAV